jgi:hypothetical protein
VKVAVSSAKVLRIVLSECGGSAVYIVYSNGPRTLPWGTPKTKVEHYFSNLFWCRILHVSDRFTAYHQQSSTVYTTIGICHTVRGS